MHSFLQSEAYASFVLSMAVYKESLGIITISDAEITQVLNVMPDVKSAFSHFCGIADQIHTTDGQVATYEIYQSEPNHNNVGVFMIPLSDTGRLQLNFLVAEVYKAPIIQMVR
jgi:hypothetical protein